jgi:tRNA (guanosine-2'-O-)-methyltransferase
LIYDDKELANIPGLREYLESFVTTRRLELIEKVLAARTRHLTIALEDIWHSPNASAIIRTCECFGVQDLAIIENTVRFKANTNVVRGAAKWITINRFRGKSKNNTEACFKYLRKNGYKIAATTLRNEKYTPLEKIPLKDKLAICFGCEETGLSDYAHAEADYFIQLPMFGFTESFNISVSVAMILQMLTSRLRKSDLDIKIADDEKQPLLINWLRKSIKNDTLLIKRFLDESGRKV